MANELIIEESLNVFGETLISCSEDPLTGFFRDGCCNTCKDDLGSHTICIKVTQVFLDYSKSQGNDLSTAYPEFGFKGLKEGDSWCLCASRWLQAYQDKAAPRVYLQRTHIKALEIVPLKYLSKFAVDLN